MLDDGSGRRSSVFFVNIFLQRILVTFFERAVLNAMDVLFRIHYLVYLVTLDDQLVQILVFPLVCDFKLRKIHPTWDVDANGCDTAGGSGHERVRVVGDRIDLHGENLVTVDSHVEFFKFVGEGVD